MRVLRFVALTLGSLLFFPVSCTTGLFVGTKYFSHADARDTERGDIPHKQAYLIAFLPQNQANILFDGNPPRPNQYLFTAIPNTLGQFVAFPLHSLAEFQKINQPYTFILPIGSGAFTIGSSRPSVSFVATSSSTTEQIVEVSMKDDTGTFFRYAASQHTIRPLYTRLWYHGYMFGAIPYALAFAIAIALLGQFLLRISKNCPRPMATPNSTAELDAPNETARGSP